jgi:hypothetical protein
MFMLTTLVNVKCFVIILLTFSWLKKLKGNNHSNPLSIKRDRIFSQEEA